MNIATLDCLDIWWTKIYLFTSCIAVPINPKSCPPALTALSGQLSRDISFKESLLQFLSRLSPGNPNYTCRLQSKLGSTLQELLIDWQSQQDNCLVSWRSMIQEEERADGDDDEPGSGGAGFISKGVIVDLIENVKFIDNDEVRCVFLGH